MMPVIAFDGAIVMVLWGKSFPLLGAENVTVFELLRDFHLFVDMLID